MADNKGLYGSLVLSGSMEFLSGYEIISIDHSNVAVKDMEHYLPTSICEKDNPAHLLELKNALGIDELLFLHTCNRIMFFMYQKPGKKRMSIDRFMEQWMGKQICPVMPQVAKRYQGVDALRHLFYLSASVESLVVGEREILRQIRESYDHCSGAGLCGDHIRVAMKYMVKGAKKVYAKSRIGEKAVSVASIAMRRLEDYGVNEHTRYLMIGAGQTIQLISKILKGQSHGPITLYNRSLENAEKVRALLPVEIKALSDLPAHDEEWDVMIICTGATTPIITDSLMDQITSPVSDKRRVIVDLSVPSGVSAQAQLRPDVQFISIDQLRLLAKENMEFRRREVTKAKEILEDHLLEFIDIHFHRQIERALTHIPVEIEKIKHRAIHKVYQKDLEQMDEHTREKVLEMIHYMAKKCTAIPMRNAKAGVKKPKGI